MSTEALPIKFVAELWNEDGTEVYERRDVPNDARLRTIGLIPLNLARGGSFVAVGREISVNPITLTMTAKVFLKRNAGPDGLLSQLDNG